MVIVDEHVEDQGHVQVGSPFFDDACRAAIGQHGVARQMESALVAAAGDLGLEAVTDDAHAIERDPGVSAEIAFQGRHHPSEGGDGRKAPGHRAGNGVGVLHADVWQHQHGFVHRDGLFIAHGQPRVLLV